MIMLFVLSALVLFLLGISLFVYMATAITVTLVAAIKIGIWLIVAYFAYKFIIGLIE